MLVDEDGLGESLLSLGPRGREHCGNFVPLGIGNAVPYPRRSFTVRLHFAELLRENRPGDRVFDVKLQGQVVAEELDIVREAGAPLRALVRELTGIEASERLTLELVPKAKTVNGRSAPLLSGLELRDETFRPAIP